MDASAGRRCRRFAAVALATIAASLTGCGAAASKPAARSSGHTAEIRAAVHAGEGLAIALLLRLGQGGGNVVFSPYGIESALTMVDAGARGSSATEIDHVLHTARPAAVAAGLAAAAARLTAVSTAPNAPRVHVANGLWVRSGLALKKPFIRTLSSLFGASPQSVDFAGAPDTARRMINSWVAARTAHRIVNLFPSGTITGQTAVVLADAIYLAAHWANPFTPSATAPGPFYTDAGPTAQVPFMTQTPVALAYGRGRGYRAIDLPYLRSTLSMLLVMPTPRTLAHFEQGLSVGSFARLERSLSPKRVDLHVPRFRLTFDTELNPILSELGMPVPFTGGADFSGITAQTRLKLSAVEHAASLRVDEQGTVATAATGIAIEPTAVAPEPATRLTLDHPFLVVLRDDATGTILFVAQVTDPAEPAPSRRLAAPSRRPAAPSRKPAVPQP